MLTAKELEMIGKLGTLLDEFNKTVDSGLIANNVDAFSRHINALQMIIMVRAVQRSHDIFKWSPDRDDSPYTLV